MRQRAGDDVTTGAAETAEVNENGSTRSAPPVPAGSEGEATGPVSPGASGSSREEGAPEVTATVRIPAFRVPFHPMGRPDAGTSASGIPVSDTPASDTPVSDIPVSDTPASDTPASDTPEGNVSGRGAFAGEIGGVGVRVIEGETTKGRTTPADAAGAPPEGARAEGDGSGGETVVAGALPAGPSAGAPDATASPAEETDTTAEVRLPAPPRTPADDPPGTAAPAVRRSRVTTLMRTASVWLPPLLTVEGLIMYVLALRVAPGPWRGVDLAEVDGLGLVSALPGTAFAAIMLMIVAFFVTIAQNTDRKFLLLFQLAAITFALHGAAALVENEARFHTAYVHAGFVEYISRTGESSAILDARLAWPGFFALVAFVTKAAGITDLTTIMQWTPLLSNLLYLLPFVLILRQVVATTRARWFAALLFVIVQWIGQDYFSSQGFTYAVYLAFVAILLRWFGRVDPRGDLHGNLRGDLRGKPQPSRGLIRRAAARLGGLTPGELSRPTGVYDRSIMLIVLIGLFGIATASHQITPFMMLGILTGLLLFRRTSLSWGLPFLLGLVALSWISYQTVAFWSGHIDELFGDLGRVLDNLQSNTGDRIDGSDPEHAPVLTARLGICAVILALAATGLLRRLRRGVGDRAALLLLCTPVLALGLQNYGGEIGLRIYLFALPGACVLAAYAFFPNLPAATAGAPEETAPARGRFRFGPALTRRISLVSAAVCALALSMAFLVARYGNEQFERVSADEVAAMHYIYDHDKPSARVLYLVPLIGEEVTPAIPWGEKDFDRISYEQALVSRDPAQISSVIDKFRVSPPNTYLITTRGQAGYLQLNHNFPDDWASRFRTALDASPELKRVFTSDDAAVYTMKSFPEGVEIPEPGASTGIGDPTSPWTPIGLGALGVTWIALFAYELSVLRGRGRGRVSRARRWILLVAVPAFLVALVVIAERFVVIGAQQP
ncbi:hypothetical protein [Streptosporangium lutulentum]|uniref:hypothetical protein n=1 Tax=Streptosporangium lutulentum TaxID=1461250 RepID=UPI0036307332